MLFPKMLPGQTSFLLSLLLLQHSYNVAASGIQFTSPPGGATFPAGDFTARWKDAGGSPPLMSDLTKYILDLMVGGNSPDDSRPIQSLAHGEIQEGSADCNISSNVAQSIQNGFYLRMTANTTDGNTTINYSPRFTLIQMTGSTDPQYVQGASSTVGDNNVPLPQLVLHASSSPSSSIAAPTPASTDTPDTSDNNSTQISTAAIVGITISISVICTALIISAGWYLRQRKRKEILRKSLPPHALGSKAELAADSPASSPDLELNDRSPIEMASSNKAEELEGSTIIHELESDWSGWEMSARRSQHQIYDPTR